MSKDVDIFFAFMRKIVKFLYRNKGYTDKWIEGRLKGILDRKKHNKLTTQRLFQQYVN